MKSKIQKPTKEVVYLRTSSPWDVVGREKERGIEDDTHISGLGDSWMLAMKIQEETSMIIRLFWGGGFGE